VNIAGRPWIVNDRLTNAIVASAWVNLNDILPGGSLTKVRNVVTVLQLAFSDDRSQLVGLVMPNDDRDALIENVIRAAVLSSNRTPNLAMVGSRDLRG
jgi:hypothetical protein